MEWWDSLLLGSATYEQVCDPQRPRGVRGCLEGVTKLVEHPITLRPPAEPTSEVAIPVYLTKKERKKLRRQVSEGFYFEILHLKLVRAFYHSEYYLQDFRLCLHYQ